MASELAVLMDTRPNMCRANTMHTHVHTHTDTTTQHAGNDFVRMCLWRACGSSVCVRRNSYNIRFVKAAFDFAYLQLTAPSNPEESLLARILR